VHLAEYSIRKATPEDSLPIRALIHAVRINPMSLDWRHFVVAVDLSGGLLGCGQVKVHSDGSHELASIAVRESARGKGIARAVIETLLESETFRPMYLMCRSRLEPLYARFGFQPVQVNEMPPYFQRLHRLARLLNANAGPGNHLSVMRLD